jgi:hypothetical protein
MAAIVLLLLALLGSVRSSEISFERIEPKNRPTVESVEKALSVRAVQCMGFTVHGGADSYITRWHPGVAVDVEWKPEKPGGVPRVKRLKFRARRERENFIPLRYAP